MSLDLSMPVCYHCSCVVSSRVKIGKPRRTAPVVGAFGRGRGGAKGPGFGRTQGPGRTMLATLPPLKKKSKSLDNMHLQKSRAPACVRRRRASWWLSGQSWLKPSAPGWCGATAGCGTWLRPGKFETPPGRFGTKTIPRFDWQTKPNLTI